MGSDGEMGKESRILVVEDSEAGRRILEDVLESQGYQVTTAPDGHQAWMVLQEARFSYHLVITDFMMPGMDGIDLLTKIRADCPWVKVVLITGHRDRDIASRAKLLGAFAVLSKPCSIEKLNGTVMRALLK